jgi:translation elongation factor EF-G
VPLDAIIGYTTYLRSVSKGGASLLMKLKGYEAMGGLRQKEIMTNPP